jgi:glutaredoxin 2
MPIYDGKQKQLQYSKIDIAEKIRASYQSFFTSQYQQQVAQLTQQLSATDDLIADINNQLKYTQSLIDVNGKLLEAGEVRITDYIVALNNYINAKNLITQNNINRLQIINQLNYWNR